ncbi:MAG: hypothetical protein EON59_02060 [Alphaproteobacteria bacterium]|nr:MAG: hypothetical protein EON59_02060 [Alphaproteobacteria bacterium]
MQREAFKAWLVAQNQAPSSVSTRLSDTARVEGAYGDLDGHYDADELQGLLATFAYSAQDRASQKPNPTSLEINGDLYDGLATYRSALSTYARFRASADDPQERQADRIRRFVLENHIEPARAQGESRVEVVTGDVHRAMALDNKMPAVCSALGSGKFEELAGVKIIDRQGPANSSTVRFTYDLAANETGNWAERVLRQRYGAPIAKSDKMVSFALTDARQVALQLDVGTCQIWLEDDESRKAPPVDQIRHYLAAQPRHSNLPPRMRHSPPGGMAPRRVALVKIENAIAFAKVLDWYEGKSGGALNREALERYKKLFLARYAGFADFGVQAGGYYEEERRYKDALIARAGDIRSQGLGAAETGTALLDLLTGKAGLSSGLLGWRTDSRVAALRQSHPGVLEEAAGALAQREDPVSGVEHFVQAIWQTLTEDQKSKPYSESRNIPSMLAALLAPADAFGINTDPIQRTAEALLGRKLLGWNPMTAVEYREVLELARAIEAVMRDEWDWKPRDLWDVQGFIWAVSRSDQPAINDEPVPQPVVAKEDKMPTNLILYGPPGTGKTHATAAEAIRLCDGSVPATEEQIRQRYAELVTAGQVRFVTFHQSYAYEDFVEGLRPSTGAEDETNTTGGFKLEPVPGVFREISSVAEQALKSAGAGEPFDVMGRQVFKMSLGRAGSEDHIFDAAIEGDYIVLGWGGEIDWTPYDSYEAIHAKWNEIHPGTNGNDGNIAMVARFRADMREGDLVVVSYGNHKFRAIGEIVGPYQYAPTEVRDYNHRRAVRWLFVPDEPLPLTFYERPFTMRSCYLLRDRYINREALALLLPGQNGGAPAAPRQFVLIIDEINRANISKVFGELITLIEPDKRIGADFELKVVLPYSKQPFGVPSNLNLIGTMNTADRSIALLDTALRRRFEFKELMPDPSKLESVDGIDLGMLLERMNSRIEYLFDREHQIGHTFFMKAKNRSDLDTVMRRKVIPLLAEYFHEDWKKIAVVLGDLEGTRFFKREVLPVPAGVDADYGSERSRWSVRETFSEDAYLGLQ